MRCNRAPSSHHSVFSFDDLLCFGGAVLAVKLHPLINTRRRSSESFYAATFECVQSAGVALGLVEVILPPAHLRAVHAAGTRLACVRMFVLSTVPSFLCATQSTPSGQSTSDLCPVSAMAYQNLHPLCVCFVCASCVCLCVCVCLFVFCVDVCLYVFVCVCLCAFICFCFGPCVRGFFFFFFFGGGGLQETTCLPFRGRRWMLRISESVRCLRPGSGGQRYCSSSGFLMQATATPRSPSSSSLRTSGTSHPRGSAR